MKRTISEPMQKRLVALFFLFLTVLGLCLGGGYGVPWDEKMEQEILKQNIFEYANIFLGADNPKVHDVSRHVVRISVSIERDHGSAPFYPLLFIIFLEDAHLVMQIWHTYVWLLFMLGVIAIYIIMREIGLPRIIGCMASLLYISLLAFLQKVIITTRTSCCFRWFYAFSRWPRC